MGWMSMNATQSPPRRTKLAGNLPANISQKTQAFTPVIMAPSQNVNSGTKIEQNRVFWNILDEESSTLAGWPFCQCMLLFDPIEGL